MSVSMAATATIYAKAAAYPRASVEDELVQLMNEHEHKLYSFVLVLVRDPDVTRDCIQDTFLRAYESMRKGRPINKQWIYTVARNRAMDAIRYRKKVKPDLPALEQETIPGPTDQPMIVRNVMEQLPPLDRQVLYLFSVVGLKSDEIAEQLGIEGAAVRQRLYRARARFRLLYSSTSAS